MGVDRQFVEGDLIFFFVVVVVVAVGVEAVHTNTNSQNNKQGITNIKLIKKHDRSKRHIALQRTAKKVKQESSIQPKNVRCVQCSSDNQLTRQ